ncbi:hypothetical protein HBB16_02805 [Pseudonocardia sp. MCCB 268]|nr:hypothetical protein [Pseudonocardia cytotoxica]
MVNDRALRLGFVFVLGALGHLFDDRIVLRVDLLLAAGRCSRSACSCSRTPGAQLPHRFHFVFLWFRNVGPGVVVDAATCPTASTSITGRRISWST